MTRGIPTIDELRFELDVTTRTIHDLARRIRSGDDDPRLHARLKDKRDRRAYLRDQIERAQRSRAR